jgi:cilia- and flagella-associated protein 52
MWDLQTGEVVHRLVLHKGAIQAVAFSPSEKFLATLGGRDDNKLIVWHVESGEPICGATAANETAYTVRWFNNSDASLVTGGAYNLRVWGFDVSKRQLYPTDCHLGQLKRVVDSIAIDAKDEYMYCGTKTGDVIQVSLGASKLFKVSTHRHIATLSLR